MSSNVGTEDVQNHVPESTKTKDFIPNDVEFDSAANSCLITQLEKDLQCIFDYLHNKFPCANSRIISRNILKKGSVFQRGDFLLSLKSSRIFFISGVKEDLLNKLNEIPYISESVIDDCGNLILCLDRNFLYKSILKDVMDHKEIYGMKRSNASYLILVHNEVFSDFDSLRIALIANHIVSFLTSLGAKVSVNEFKKVPDLLFKEVSKFECTYSCLNEINLTKELIENSLQGCESRGNKWIAVDNTEGINIALKKFANTYYPLCVKDVDDISVIKNKSNIISQGAYTLHFILNHGVQPDHIIHICLQNEKRKIIESGLLIEMLELLNSPQSYIACQNTHSNADPEVLLMDYVKYQKKGIENAMKDKYSLEKLEDPKWGDYFIKLVDTTLKFNFLRAGINDPLKIDLAFNQKALLSNKDGIFVQYNFARVSNIFKNFELKVEEGYYEKLPSIDEIDFSVLKFEEEWNLFKFVLSFPRLIDECLLFLSSKHFFPVNKIQIMLTELCHSFSKYYRRIHILGGPQLQIQKVMHARLWLLKGVHQILHNSLYLLNIEGLNDM